MSAATVQLSVLIASHNRQRLLRRCLDSLAAQTADPASFEVIVADDGSGDNTAEIVEAMRTPFALRVLRLEKGGKSAALNAAIAAAAAPTCLFLDDDIVASPDLIAGHLGAHTNGRVLGIGAITEQPPAARDWYAYAFAQGWAEHNAELATRPARWTDCYGANFSAPLEALRDVGGFSVELAVAEDFDIAFRLWRAGCAPVYLPRADGLHDDQKRSARMLTDARRQGEVHVELAGEFAGDERRAARLARRRRPPRAGAAPALPGAAGPAHGARLAGPPPARRRPQDDLAALRPPALVLGRGPRRREHLAVGPADSPAGAPRQARADLAAGAAGR